MLAAGKPLQACRVEGVFSSSESLLAFQRDTRPRGRRYREVAGESGAEGDSDTCDLVLSLEGLHPEVAEAGDLMQHIARRGDRIRPQRDRQLGQLAGGDEAALFAEEIVEAIRYVEDPDFYQPSVEDPDVDNGKIWLGAADDTVFRKRGVEFVDGTAPGFAAMVGAAPDPETGARLRADPATDRVPPGAGLLARTDSRSTSRGPATGRSSRCGPGVRRPL